jgi:hypothetical protein
MKLIKYLKSKTVAFGAILAIAGLVQDNVNYLQPFLSPDDYGKAVALIGIAVVILRAVTTQSLFEKASK